MPPSGPWLPELPDHPVLMDNSNVLSSPTTGECAVQYLNQKNNSGNDQQTISQEDNNSTIVCQVPPPSQSNSSAMTSELSATALPTGNSQSQACCYKQGSDLIQSRAPADAHSWPCYGTKGKKRKHRVKRSIKVPSIGNKLVDIPPDDYSWRKYGQKPIKGSPYSRGYYKCSSMRGCPARKHSERCLEEPSMLIVTYEGEHNHPKLPSRATTSS
ncbi:hypothetical protein GOBAR_DD33593 [Gossypium barbadense]|nr:hypothetical protein GOBAR_DD33593 [Gossypium barbadense]